MTMDPADELTRLGEELGPDIPPDEVTAACREARHELQADPAHRHGGPDAGWYVPVHHDVHVHHGWQRIGDGEVGDHDDAAHFMSDPNGRTMGGNGGGIYWDPANTHIISGPLSFTSHGGASIGQKPPAS